MGTNLAGHMGAVLKGQDLEQGAQGMQGTCSCLLSGRAAGLRAAPPLPDAPFSAEYFLEAWMVNVRTGVPSCRGNARA